jgi:hypothetical protein
LLWVIYSVPSFSFCLAVIVKYLVYHTERLHAHPAGSEVVGPGDPLLLGGALLWYCASLLGIPFSSAYTTTTSSSSTTTASSTTTSTLSSCATTVSSTAHPLKNDCPSHVVFMPILCATSGKSLSISCCFYFPSVVSLFACLVLVFHWLLFCIPFVVFVRIF